MRALGLACVILASCSSSGGGPDADTVAALTCVELRARAVARLPQLDGACDTVDDCVLVGAPTMCSCSPSLAGGNGAGLSKAGAADPELVALEAAFADRCVAAPCSSSGVCICDAGRGLLSCVNRRCTVIDPGCHSGPDAPAPRPDAP